MSMESDFKTAWEMYLAKWDPRNDDMKEIVGLTAASFKSVGKIIDLLIENLNAQGLHITYPPEGWK